MTTALERALARPGRAVTVRGLDGPADERAVATLFDDTVLLGGGFAAVPAGFDTYRDLCTGWYLGPGRDAVGLAVDTGDVPVGYAFVCTDEESAHRWARRAVLRAGGAIGRTALHGHLDRAGAAFYRARLRDLGGLVRARASPPAPAHAHLNVVAGARRGEVTIALIGHIDAVCRAAGHSSWYGEMNERAGRRRRGLERLGFRIVASAPNRTLTAAVGERVERLTVVRFCGHD
jgi:hypothetical protein